MSKDFGSDSSLTRPIWACYHDKYRTMGSLLHSLNGCSSLPEFFKISLCSLFVCFLGILGSLTHQLRQNLVGRLFHTCQFICVDAHNVVLFFVAAKIGKISIPSKYLGSFLCFFVTFALQKLLCLGNEKEKVVFLLHFARLFVTLRSFERELTPSRQKKKQVSLFCARLFVTLPAEWAYCILYPRQWAIWRT